MSPALPSDCRHRPMSAADIPAVHALETRLFPHDAWPVEMFRAEIAHPTRAYTAVLDEAEQVIAYAGMMAVAEIADVQTVAVAPEHEGRGIGRWLLHRMHEQARTAGAQRMMLEVRQDNARARALYEGLGYRAVHIRPRYYRDGADAVIMQKDLAPQPGRDGAVLTGAGPTGAALTGTASIGAVGAEALAGNPQTEEEQE
ncbi:ribosomal protein S18-alanine N-acetyltransferase [Rothia sp. BD8]|uniref:ribosomal protein S18-alanine N-acetyltransferase n=1 Tax=Rothia TaxID=32207 RepID=UPI0009BF632E|nr:ribosomal protein S18-alanine N-acetyltransferase [Rothia kristinae]WGH09938.1 ribosomal protein S18-alanine N-acetyltransferase [Rothia kristinae]